MAKTQTKKHLAKHHSNTMDKVKIKRVKRNHKKITTKEKILGGLGLGATLIGGVSQVTPQQQKTQFVRTQSAGEEGPGTSKIKETLKKLFTNTFSVPVAHADEGDGTDASVVVPEETPPPLPVENIIPEAAPAPTPAPNVAPPLPVVSSPAPAPVIDDHSGGNYTGPSLDALFNSAPANVQTPAQMLAQKYAATASPSATTVSPTSPQVNFQPLSRPVVTTNPLSPQQIPLSFPSNFTATPKPDGSIEGDVVVNGIQQRVAVLNGVVYGSDGLPMTDLSNTESGNIISKFTSAAAQSTTSTSAPNNIDTSSLSSVTPDINNSKTGTVNIGGVATTVSVLPDGRVFDSNGQQMNLQEQDQNALVEAFNNASISQPPVSTSQAASVDVSNIGMVSPNINESKSGTILINGYPITVTVLPSGQIYDTNGQDITSSFLEKDQAAIKSAFESAPVFSSETVNNTNPLVATPSDTGSNPTDFQTPKAGDTKNEKGFNYTFANGSWVLNDLQEDGQGNISQNGTWVSNPNVDAKPSITATQTNLPSLTGLEVYNTDQGLAAWIGGGGIDQLVYVKDGNAYDKDGNILSNVTSDVIKAIVSQAPAPEAQKVNVPDQAVLAGQTMAAPTTQQLKNNANNIIYNTNITNAQLTAVATDPSFYSQVANGVQTHTVAAYILGLGSGLKEDGTPYQDGEQIVGTDGRTYTFSSQSNGVWTSTDPVPTASVIPPVVPPIISPGPGGIKTFPWSGPTAPVIPPKVVPASSGQQAAATNASTPLFPQSAFQPSVVINSPLGPAPGNKLQFATKATADEVAKLLGGTVTEIQLDGPGYSYTNAQGTKIPQYIVTFPGSNGGMNAGLVADTLNRYGNNPSSYGMYLLARDKASITDPANAGNFPSYNAWATSQPGFVMDPKLSNSGPGYNYIAGVNANRQLTVTITGDGRVLDGSGKDVTQMLIDNGTIDKNLAAILAKAKAQAASGQSSPSAEFQHGVIVNSPLGPSAANPLEWATPDAAAALAQKLGGTVTKVQLTGPGYSYSSPQLVITFPNGSGAINAGLALQELNNYGGGSFSYGSYLLARDQAAITDPKGAGSFPSYDTWAHAQPGFVMDPKLSNSGPGYNYVNGVNIVKQAAAVAAAVPTTGQISLGQNLGTNPVKNNAPVSITSVVSRDTAGSNTNGILKDGYIIEIGGHNLSGAYTFYSLVVNGVDLPVNRANVTDNKITLFPEFPSSLINNTPMQIRVTTKTTGIVQGILASPVFVYNKTAGTNAAFAPRASDSQILFTLSDQAELLQSRINDLSSHINSSTPTESLQAANQTIAALNEQIAHIQTVIRNAQNSGSVDTESASAVLETGNQISELTAPQTNTYTVKNGDTLWSIAKKFYGDGTQWRRILARNSKQVDGPKNLRVGTILTIPPL